MDNIEIRRKHKNIKEREKRLLNGDAIRERDRARYQKVKGRKAFLQKLNKVRVNKRRREWREKNKEKIAAGQRAYRLANRETIRAKTREWYERNKAIQRVKARAWRAINGDKLRASRRRSYKRHKEHARKYRVANAEKIKDRNKRWREANREALLAKQYHAPVEEIRDILSRRNNGCAICGKLTKLRIDHNHTTGKLRDLLCNACNWGIGHFRENPETMRKAASYIEAFNGEDTPSSS